MTGGVVNLAWPSHPGRRYRVETSPTLAPPIPWVPVGSDIIATGAVQSLIYPGGTNAHRFYRVLSFDN